METILVLALAWLFAPALSVLVRDDSVGGASQMGGAAAVAIQEVLDAVANAASNPASLASTQNKVAARAAQPAADAQNKFRMSQIRFNRASSVGRSEEEHTFAKELATAMKSTVTVGKPEPVLRGSHLEFSCLPDVNRCPRGWQQKGTLCVATAGYKGECKNHLSLFDLAVEGRLALAHYCKVEFNCQEDCLQDLTGTCPSLWKQVSLGVCEAPSNYIGQCAHRAHMGAMSDTDKIAFALRCGARWPCTSAPGHSYVQVCPQGWTELFGQTCKAPSSYRGPCGIFAKLANLTKLDKQVFEAECGVSWPSLAAECETDYEAVCPYGWEQRGKLGGVDCVAPSSYEGCSRIQDFGAFSHVLKQRWERNCAQRWPCVGEAAFESSSRVVVNGPVQLTL